MEENLNSPKQIVEKYMNASVVKTKHPIWKLLLLGVMAGAYIAFGASSSSAAMHSVADVGVARTLAGSIFPVGLMLIVLMGGELFTGDCLMIMGAVDKRYSVLNMIKVLVLVWLSNMVGAIIVAWLVYQSGQLGFTAGALGAFTIKVAYGKATLKFFPALISGILCNMLVCLAVFMASTAKDVVGKIFAIFFPILAFVIGGYEHCVANMYYIPAGIIAMNNSVYVEKAMELYGYTADQLANLNWGSMFITNLIPVTIGNIIGGMVGVGLPMYFMNRDKK